MANTLSLTIPALLFPAISLFYLSYNGRFIALAQLIRNLCKEWSLSQDESTLEQIQSLRKRLGLIRLMQIFGASAFITAAASMGAIFLGYNSVGKILFGVALVLLMSSLGTLLRENTMSIRALELQLKKVVGDKNADV